MTSISTPSVFIPSATMHVPNSVQPANEHDTMIKPQGVLLTNLFLP